MTASRQDQSSAPSGTLPARAWRALATHPHAFIVVAFGLAIALLASILWRGLLLAQDREIESIGQMLALRAASVDAVIQREAERVLSVRNYVEHLLQNQQASPTPPDADLRAAFSRRGDAIWSVASHDVAAVYGVGPAQLHGINGFTRSDTDLIAEMAVARSLSHLLSAAPEHAGIQRQIIWLSANGLIVSSPAIPRQDIGKIVQWLGASRFFQDSILAQDQAIAPRAAVGQVPGPAGDLSLILSVPIYAHGVFRGVAMLEIPRRSLDDYLNQVPDHDVNSYLADRSGRLVGASARNVRRGEALLTALAGNWTPATLKTMFETGAARLEDDSGHRLLVRRLDSASLVLVDELSSSDLLAASARRLSGMIGAGAGALALLLCATLVLVHTLFRHYLSRGEALRELAETDALTGLPNRRVFAARFAQEAARSTAEQLPLSLIMLDIDYFKRINDRWGHATGDVVLRAVAQVLRGSVRKTDLPARLGGEEFAVLLPRTTFGEAKHVAEQLREQIQLQACDPAQDASNREPIRFTASFGVAECPAHASPDLDALLRIADERLYQAKSAGRNRVVAQ